MEECVLHQFLAAPVRKPDKVDVLGQDGILPTAALKTPATATRYHAHTEILTHRSRVRKYIQI